MSIGTDPGDVMPHLVFRFFNLSTGQTDRTVSQREQHSQLSAKNTATDSKVLIHISEQL